MASTPPPSLDDALTLVKVFYIIPLDLAGFRSLTARFLVFENLLSETPSQIFTARMTESSELDTVPSFSCPLPSDLLQSGAKGLFNLTDGLSEAVHLLRGDPSSSDEEHIRIMLVQTEIERVKFIVRSYVRTRLFKIEKYARFVTSNADVQRRLTAAERDHASRHAKITDQHFYLSVLQSLPEAQAHLDDTPVFYPSMVTEPDKSRPVFVHALTRCPRITLPDGATLDMEKGHISLTLYSVVEQLVARGEVELI
ncbi:uncharacterized protein LACBIDRAFT_294753 [Laccaria bicolor S238N-H82]|uniref:DNA replication complex GINS protein SLD5 n=1 Tax=Laccaria bicolor (strain S238N-H82 / ATCC MYA-4686) TaxID=486041 RepID=B0DHJ1_LACBS|nr:uncharacterized protein LACBIDRAFT_294753 [Laccaria bicolor S238N-H82]EDR06116.1 predicted protein [Laccaria bicolor S238N-H82]|eukprot:XP_001883404.1 predicted protein [Laccaria bicolor S238N-H82]